MEWLTSCGDALLAPTALLSSFQLFKDHRAPSVGFFMLGVSAGLGVLNPASSVQTEAQWASEVLAPALVSFHLLWLSEDHNTALLLLCGPCLLLALSDSFSVDTLALMTRCAGLSSLSCSLTVWLFAGNALGALASVTLCLPSLLSARFTPSAFGSPVSTGASEGWMEWVLELSLCVGCWTAARALPTFLSHLSDRCGLSI